MGIYQLSNIDSDKNFGRKAWNLSILIKNNISTVDGIIITEPYSVRDIEEAWNSLERKRPLVVRSSMGMEDNNSLSNAGKFLTVLGVKSKKLFEESILRVIESGDPNYHRAVLIQPMVNSEISGVMFTESPYSTKQVIIESTYGLGELLVSGKITPDYYSIDKQSCEITETKITNRKVYGLFMDENFNIGDIINFDFGSVRYVAPIGENKYLGSIPYITRNKGSLNKEQIQELLAIGSQLENLFNCPLDIEWTISNKKVIILQARPIVKPKLNNLRFEEYIVLQGETTLKGIPASPGFTQGKVALIDKDKLYKDWEEQNIIVGYETHPRLVHEIIKAKGIVTEIGGILCHAAIAAREIGIPCVVGVKNATSMLKVGEFIAIDGNKGEIIRGEIK
jgi:pyruvate,water dikinase